MNQSSDKVKNKHNNKIHYRIWEIDALRGIAIILMIGYHMLFNLYFFAGIGWNVNTGLWKILQIIIAGTFLLLVGVSLTLSKKINFFEFFLRGIRIFGLGIIISIVTFIFLKEGWIFFGILHMIGISIIISYFFIKYKWINLIIGLLLILASMLIIDIRLNSYWLIWLGFLPNTFYTVDFFPLIPWFGVVLIGIFLGKMLYINGQRKFSRLNRNSIKYDLGLSFIGRNSLIIYLLHQPILIGIMYLIGLMY
ncbi:MAG: heparan-alpha-glucosaminide N-acetyltransferase [Candidatus Woesearchaeota archaeon]